MTTGGSSRPVPGWPWSFMYRNENSSKSCIWDGLRVETAQDLIYIAWKRKGQMAPKAQEWSYITRHSRLLWLCPAGCWVKPTSYDGQKYWQKSGWVKLQKTDQIFVQPVDYIPMDTRWPVSVDLSLFFRNVCPVWIPQMHRYHLSADI